MERNNDEDEAYIVSDADEGPMYDEETADLFVSFHSGHMEGRAAILTQAHNNRRKQQNTYGRTSPTTDTSEDK